jgi:hypothetical protein
VALTIQIDLSIAHHFAHGRMFLKVGFNRIIGIDYNSGCCLHCYFYFIDKDAGLCYLRVPAWALFRLQWFNLLTEMIIVGGQKTENMEFGSWNADCGHRN